MGPVLRQESHVIHQAYSNAIAYSLRGRLADADEQLNALGNYLLIRMKARIRAGISPPLKPSTIRRRRQRGYIGTTPLIESSQFIDSLNFYLIGRTANVTTPTAPSTTRPSFWGRFRNIFGV